MFFTEKHVIFILFFFQALLPFAKALKPRAIASATPVTRQLTQPPTPAKCSLATATAKTAERVISTPQLPRRNVPVAAITLAPPVKKRCVTDTTVTTELVKSTIMTRLWLFALVTPVFQEIFVKMMLATKTCVSMVTALSRVTKLSTLVIALTVTREACVER